MGTIFASSPKNENPKSHVYLTQNSSAKATKPQSNFICWYASCSIAFTRILSLKAESSRLA
jgi:hypothetical protein